MRPRRPNHAPYPRSRTPYLALALALLAACGEAKDGGARGTTRASAATGRGSEPRIVALASRDAATPDAGALHGTVRFEGTPPERFPLASRKKPECCEFDDVEHLSDVVVVEDGCLANVLVRVTRGFDADDVPAPPDSPVVLDQRGCTYMPHVLALQAGRPLLVANSDPTTHNVHATPRKNSGPGNRNLGAGQAPFELRYDRAETSIRFKCDLHPWMEAWVHVVEHPWFAVTGRDGAFTIEGLAPGTYTIEALHEVYGRGTASGLVVEAGRSTGFDVVYRAP